MFNYFKKFKKGLKQPKKRIKTEKEKTFKN